MSTKNAPKKAPSGAEISCKGWHQEATMRMLMNNLDPNVAEKPDEFDDNLHDRLTVSLNEARDIIEQSDQPISVGLLGNIAEVLPEMVRRNMIPDIVTDQTSAHDLREGYIPIG